MPRHLVIATEIMRQVSKYASRTRSVGAGIGRSDKMALNYAWKGFKHKSSIVSGVRTGLFAGSIVGAIVNSNAPDTPGNGPPIQYVPQTSPPYKARGGQTGRSNRRYNSNKRFNKYKRCTCARKHYRSRNR